jgi:hypothetical protein
MRMISAYKFRLYPDEEQEKTLDNQLGICKELYNGAHRERLERGRMSHTILFAGTNRDDDGD